MMNMIKRIILSGLILVNGITRVLAQSYPLTIEEMFRLADQNSKSIRAHQLAIYEAKEGIEVAKNDRLPSLGAQAQFNYIGDGVMTDRDFSNGIHADMPHFGNSFVVKATQAIYEGGRVTHNIKQAKLHKQAAEQEYNENRQNLRFLLIGHYLDLFQLNNQKAIYEKNIEQTQLLVKEMQAAYKQGTALKSDITRYELQLQNLELSLTNTNNRIDIINYKLSTTIGLPPHTQIMPDTTLLKLMIDKREEQEWILAGENAPKLQIADIQIDLSKNKQRLIHSERLPHISLTAANDLTGPILIEVPPMNNNFTYWYAGIGISYSFDALFKANKKIKQARVETKRMEENRRLLQEEIENEIHTAYVNLNEAYIRLRTQQKSVQLSHENYNIVHQRYLNGLALITDMLDASNTQLDMELQLSNYQIGILYQYYLLRKIAGIL